MQTHWFFLYLLWANRGEKTGPPVAVYKKVCVIHSDLSNFVVGGAWVFIDQGRPVVVKNDDDQSLKCQGRFFITMLIWSIDCGRTLPIYCQKIKYLYKVLPWHGWQRTLSTLFDSCLTIFWYASW